MPLDLEKGRDLVLALLPELILTGWALLLCLQAAWRHRRPGAQREAGWLSLVGVVLAGGAAAWLWKMGVSIEGVPQSVAVDPFRWAASLIILTGTALTTVLAIGYLEREGIDIPEFHALVQFAAIGMLFMVSGADLLVIFLGLETMSVSVYALAGINRRSAASAEAALKYFLFGAFASGFLLYGVALLYGATGSTKLGIISFQVLAPAAGTQVMLWAGIALLFVGFGFKVAAVPFHMWAPDVYDGAPTPVTVFMAATVKAAAFGALVRLLLQALYQVQADWSQVVWWLAAVTMIVGNLLALAQRSLKRMLAYSSVAHAGYILAALVAGSVAGAAAFLFYLMFYSLTTLAAFTVLVAKGREGERDVTTDDLAGLSESHPWLALAMAVSMLSLLGFPGTAGFIGKWYILASATGAGYAALAVVLVLTSVVSAGYYLPVIMAMYMKPAGSEGAHAGVALPRAASGALALVTVATVLFGVWPAEALRAARAGSSGFLPRQVTSIARPVPMQMQPTPADPRQGLPPARGPSPHQGGGAAAPRALPPAAGPNPHTPDAPRPQPVP